MKKIEAVIRVNKFDDVKDALIKVGVRGLTAYEVRGRGSQIGNVVSGDQSGSFMGDELIPKMKIEIACIEEELDKILTTISSKASTGEVGDGKIFVSDINEIVKIRTGERGAPAV